MNTVFPPRNARPQRGIALIEALVGILIFSFGVLGLVGLQASMTRAQTAAKFRADAANLANELIALIATDTTHLASYNSDACASYAQCADWQRKVSAVLPQGVGTPTVTAVGAGAGTVDVQLQWTQAGDDTHNYVTSTTVNP